MTDELLAALDPATPGPSPAWLATDTAMAALLVSSHARATGTALLPDQPDSARWLYADAPFCVLAHHAGPDPRFVYANQAAQRCFGHGWDAFTALPSRLSAGPAERAERQALLDAVAAHGFARIERALRVAADGRHFWIENVTVWQLVTADGRTLGQAATYRSWRDA